MPASRRGAGGAPGLALRQRPGHQGLLFASEDLALRASKASNLKNRIVSRRLGHPGPEDMCRVARNVFAVDCDDVNTRYDYPKGHSYFRSGKVFGEPGVVFLHLFASLRIGRVFAEGAPRRMTHPA